MKENNWQTLLGWTEDQVSEIRFAGISFFLEGLYQKAIIFFQALLVLDPTNCYDLKTLGALYLQIGENEKALDLLSQALIQEPQDELTRLNKTKALLILGKISEGRTLAQTLINSKDALVLGQASALLAAYR